MWRLIIKHRRTLPDFDNTIEKPAIPYETWVSTRYIHGLRIVAQFVELGARGSMRNGTVGQDECVVQVKLSKASIYTI